jgi:hypothetical protein
MANDKKSNYIEIITEYPGGSYFLSIENNKFIINCVNNDQSKINIIEQKNFLEKILKDVDIKNKYIKENKKIFFKNCFVSLENFRDIHCNIITELINNNNSNYKHNKIGSFGFLLGNTKPYRIKFIKLSETYPDKLIYISTPKFNKDDKNMMSWADIKYNFKYFIDLPGHTYTTKLYTMLFCKRLIFLFEKRSHKFKWEEKLIPNVHYIEIKNDYSDIIEKFIWAENNTDKVEKIINTAFQFAINELHPNIMINNFINKILGNLNNQKKLKFIHITKNAGTYITNTAKKNNILFGLYHKEYGHHHQLFSNVPNHIKNKYDWFMVVRNPYSRILSEYYCRWGGIGNKNIIHTNEEFNNYLIEKINTRKYHYLEQYKYLDNKYKIHIIKYENLNKELDNLYKKYNININLSDKKINSSEERNKKMLFKISDFNSKLINLINTVYNKDFTLFNYNKI